MIPQLNRLLRIDRTRVAALVVLALCVVGFHLCAVAVGGPRGWFVWLELLATALVIMRPTGATEIVLLAVLVLDWWGAGQDLTWWALPAAVLLLLVHSAVTLVVSGPETAPVPGPVLRRWVVRTLLVAVGCTAVGAVLLAAGHAAPTTSWILVPVALTALAGVTVALVESARRHRHSTQP